MKPVVVTNSTESIICDSANVDVTSLSFDIDELRRQGWACQEAGKGRGEAWFVSDHVTNWVLRHYRRGGLVGKLIRDSYAYTGVEKSRPFVEWRLMSKLYEAELPTAKPVAARLVRKGLCYRADLITEALPNVQPLSGLLAQRALSSTEWAAVGKLLRQFANFGAFHADLNAHNVLVSDQFSLYLIDWDRGRFSPDDVAAWAPKNLGRFKRSLEKIAVKDSANYQAQNWEMILAGYGAIGP